MHSGKASNDTKMCGYSVKVKEVRNSSSVLGMSGLGRCSVQWRTYLFSNDRWRSGNANTGMVEVDKTLKAGFQEDGGCWSRW